MTDHSIDAFLDEFEEWLRQAYPLAHRRRLTTKSIQNHKSNLKRVVLKTLQEKRINLMTSSNSDVFNYVIDNLEEVFPGLSPATIRSYRYTTRYLALMKGLDLGAYRRTIFRRG